MPTAQTAHAMNTLTRTPTSGHATQALPGSRDHPHKHHATTAANHPPPASPGPAPLKPEATRCLRADTHTGNPERTSHPSPTTPIPTPAPAPARSNAHAQHRKRPTTRTLPPHKKKHEHAQRERQGNAEEGTAEGAEGEHRNPHTRAPPLRQPSRPRMSCTLPGPAKPKTTPQNTTTTDCHEAPPRTLHHTPPPATGTTPTHAPPPQPTTAR